MSDTFSGQPFAYLTGAPFAANGGNVATALPEYLVDAFQRTVLYLDLLRRRGNDEEEISSRPMATVLNFDHQVLMSGRSLSKPINFSLSRIVPPVCGARIRCGIAAAFSAAAGSRP